MERMKAWKLDDRLSWRSVQAQAQVQVQGEEERHSKAAVDKEGIYLISIGIVVKTHEEQSN